MSTDTAHPSPTGTTRRPPARRLLSDRRRTVPVVLTAVAIAVGSLLVIVLSPDAATTSGPRPSPPAQAAAGVARDAIKDYVYEPATLTVRAGTKVAWTNEDDVPHSATLAGRFDTKLFGKGQTRTITFPRAGTFHYICSIHPFMRGTVVVR